MTDQGLGYGTEAWGQGHPYQGGQQPGSDPYGMPGGGYPQQPQPGWGAPQQVVDPYQGIPAPRDPYATGQYPVHPVQQPVPQQPAEPSGPVLGPDGIDWVAAAAALDAEAVQVEEVPVEVPYEEDPAESYEESYEATYEESYDEQAYEEDEDGYAPFLAEPDDSRSGQRRRKQKGKSQRKRSGVACLGMSLLLVGCVAGGGYFGYGFYQKHWGPPPDYPGEGAGLVTVTIPAGATGDAMGQVLADAGVVRSKGAFDAAYGKNSDADSIQPGIYTLPMHMSAADAIADLIKQNGGHSLIIPEGLQASAIYLRIDSGLGLKAGTTAAVAKADVGQLGLPSYANGDIEGFLWPTRYSVAPGMKPEALLQQMVSTAVQEFSSLDMDAGAKGVNLRSGYQVLIEASILQAEGNNPKDFGKIARVLYNRLNGTATNGELGLDSTIEYYLKTDHFGYAQRLQSDDGYNTYINKGLPPGPIGNPGEEAIQAVLNPTPGAWNYFIAMSPIDTQFAITGADFAKLDQQYCTKHGEGFDPVHVVCT
ncbi:endolytic transglycosylase MltG [Streptacidiphilus albus]|uniref:endolytic transglycosylase MltG n=1 Tax=Streptacidiphilus albus TaxID=105425 RepID=UPI00128BCEEB|nr:endolytic transglycosylase MltG [Streptacidiphilus albus]